MPAIAALLNMTAERGGAATLDCRCADDSDAPCCSRKAGPKRRNTSATSSPSRATKPRFQAGTRSGTVGETTLRDSNGLAVAQTVLVAIMRY